MGRPRKPSGTHLVDGTRVVRADRPRSGKDLVVSNPLGPPPEDLSARERAIWQLVGTEMPPGVLSIVDQYIMAAFCKAVALHEEASAKLKASPMLIKTKNGQVMQSPYVGIINRQALMIKGLGAELGLSPLARTRVTTGGNDPDDDNIAHYFNESPPAASRRDH